MIKLYGPHNPRRVDRRDQLGNYTPRDEPGFDVLATNLGEALIAYSKEFSVQITRYDGAVEGIEIGDPPRYFYYESQERTNLVDIHIERRDGTEICPKQNLEFILLDSDIVRIGELVC